MCVVVCVCVGVGSIRPPLLLPIPHSLSHFFSLFLLLTDLPASSLSLSQALPHALFTILTHSVIRSFISFHFLPPCLSGVEITAAPYSWLAPYVSHLLNCRICLVWHSDPSANKLCDPYLPTHAEPIFSFHLFMANSCIVTVRIGTILFVFPDRHQTAVNC